MRYIALHLKTVTPFFYPLRNCWRVQIPASESETGKRVSKYFGSKKDAERFIEEHRKTGSVQLAELSIQERHILGLIRQSADYTPEFLLDVWRSHQANQKSQLKTSLTVAQLCKAFYNRQIQEKRAYRTISDDRWRLNKFAGALGGLDSNRCTSVNISRYLEAIPPGSNRRSHYKTLRKLWRWAYRLGHVEVDPMTKIPPMDKWGVNAEHLSISVYSRLLRVAAGKEPPAKGQELTTKYKFLLPYFILAGMAGLRTCELVRSEPGDPVLNWEDILWTKNLILVRHAVAKQTRSREHKRYVPLEQKAAEILRSLASRGPVITCCDNHLYIKRRELARDMKIKLPENSLRNSYATYSLTFRSLGDVAKAMGDSEATVKRYYIETLEPDVGREWFAPKL